MRSKKPRLRRLLAYEVFLVPGLVFYIGLFIVPLIMSLYYSFTNFSLMKPGMEFVGLHNYVRVFGDEEVLASIRNTLLFALVTTIAVNVLAMLLAVGLDRKMRGVSLMRMIIFSPAVMCSLVVGYVWSYIMSSIDTGFLNTLLMDMGLISGPINWMGDVKYAMLSIIIVYIWQWTGWCMVIYLANLQTIPHEYYEVAAIDGANGFQKFFRITLPLMITSVTVNTVLFMISGLKVYDIIISTTKGGPGYATESITTVLVKRVFGMTQYGYGSAVATLLFLLIAVLTVVQLSALNAWERKVQ